MTVKPPKSKPSATTIEISDMTAVLDHVAPPVARKETLRKILVKRGRKKDAVVELFPHGISVATGIARPVLILKDRSAIEVLPVWMQSLDAGVALAELSQGATSTPHSVTRRVFEALKMNLVSCTFTELVGHHQFVDLHFTHGEDRKELTLKRIRAEEAMSFCLQSRARFYCTKALMAKCRDIDVDINKFEHNIESGLLPELRAEMEPGAKKHPYLM